MFTVDLSLIVRPCIATLTSASFHMGLYHHLIRVNLLQLQKKKKICVDPLVNRAHAQRSRGAVLLAICWVQTASLKVEYVICNGPWIWPWTWIIHRNVLHYLLLLWWLQGHPHPTSSPPLCPSECLSIWINLKLICSLANHSSTEHLLSRLFCEIPKCHLMKWSDLWNEGGKSFKTGSFWRPIVWVWGRFDNLCRF